MIVGRRDSSTSIHIGSTEGNNQYHMEFHSNEKFSMNKNDRSSHRFINILFLCNADDIKKDNDGESEYKIQVKQKKENRICQIIPSYMI